MSTPESHGPWSYNFRRVLSDELDRISGKDDGQTRDPIARAHAKQLVGLAFSGGGIRSATFNLGVLQALARLKLIGKVDYLSTVSGGGYIGSWLMAWMKRRGVKDVWAQLRPERGRQAGGSEVGEIQFLRRFSNYLTPKLGWLGADMWTVIAVYIRNLTLNFIILSTAFAFALVVPRLVARASKASWQTLSPYSLSFDAFGHSIVLHPFAIVAFAALVFAAASIVRSMGYFELAGEKSARRETIKDLETHDNWYDAKGQKAALPLTTTNFVWYDREFNDFVLKLRFRYTGAARGRVFVWTPVESGKVKVPSIEQAQMINLATSDQDRASTASINEQEPVRPTAIRPGWNTLEITCADDRCIVGVNDQTINTARIERRKKPSRFRRGRPLGGVIAIQGDAVEFEKVTVNTIESAFDTGATQGQVQRWIIAPLFVAAFLAVFLFGFGDHAANESALATASGYISMRSWLGAARIGTPWEWWFSGLVAAAVSAALVFISRLVWAVKQKRKVLVEAVAVLPGVLAIFVAAGIGGLGAWALYHAFLGCAIWEVLVWGPPAVLGAFFGTSILLVGLLGRFMPAERREWWSRLSAWLLIYSLGWIALFGVAFYGPVIPRKIAAWSRVAFGAVSLGWIVSTISGLIAARSASTGRERPSTLTDLLSKIAPYVFIAGFVILLSWAVDALLLKDAAVGSRAIGSHTLIGDQWCVLYGSDAARLGWFTAGFALICGGLSLCLDINQFSMHLLYRNRLGRCYLGASNRLRRAQPFTGFRAMMIWS